DYLASSTELGYAVTAHRAQGVTVDTAHCVVDANQPRELFYVAMTRGKHGNYVYTATQDEHETYQQADHPDNWGLMFENTATQTPKETLAKVLANETSEHTAHEIGNQEQAWSNDLGRLCHELEYLRWADRAHRTATWVQETYPDEHTRQTITTGDNWPLLVDADPAQLFDGQPQDTDTVDIIRAQCQPRQPAHSIDDGNTMANHQRQAAVDTQVQRIHAELRSRRAAVVQEQPPWTTSLPPTDTPTYQATLNKVLLWRAVANYQPPDRPIGPPPDTNESKAIRAYYEQTQHALQTPPAEPHSPPDRHNELLRSHAQLV